MFDTMARRGSQAAYGPAGVWVSATATGVLNAFTGILYAVAVGIARVRDWRCLTTSSPRGRPRVEARNRKLSACRSPSTLGSRRPWTWPRLNPRRRTRIAPTPRHTPQTVHGNATGFRLVRIIPKSSVSRCSQDSLDGARRQFGTAVSFYIFGGSHD